MSVAALGMADMEDIGQMSINCMTMSLVRATGLGSNSGEGLFNLESWQIKKSGVKYVTHVTT